MVPSARTLIVASTAVAACVWLAAPADAQRGGQNRSGGHAAAQSHAQAAPRQAPSHSSAPAYRPPSPAPRASAPAPQSYSTQGYPQARPLPPQYRGDAQAPSSSRGIVGARVPPPNASIGPRAMPRSAPYYDSNRYQAGRAYPQQRFSAPGRVARGPVFVQPYYRFRPRFNLGFGIFVGYPIAYPYAYYDPYGFYNYGVGVLPGYDSGYGSGATYGYSSSYDQLGGLSFDIDPTNASIYIDGQYAGVAADFSSAQMPLTMAAGRHHIELRAQGYLTASFDISVVAGQVVPYEGSLQVIR